jgi:hypothetical protein
MFGDVADTALHSNCYPSPQQFQTENLYWLSLQAGCAPMSFYDGSIPEKCSGGY